MVFNIWFFKMIFFAKLFSFNMIDEKTFLLQLTPMALYKKI
jgi:hypothetical protein